MMRRDARAYVADMIQAREDIRAMVTGVQLEAFAAEGMRPKAVVRDLEVLGEACRGLPAELRVLASRVPWAKIVAMRNRPVHEYFGVDPGIIFQTAVEDVPSLLPELRKLMAELGRRTREDGDGLPS
jgi:uncharacterized protein with HEPN domain